jgi:hypothetical protein
MANQKLTDAAITAAPLPLEDADLYYVVRGSTSHKTTFSDIKTAIADFVAYPEAANFAALPAAASNSGVIYVVIAAQGVYFVNRKPAGLYRSDGATWVYLADETEAYFQDTLAWTNITSKPATFTPSAHTHPSTDVTDFTEASQDAVGAMVDSTLVYNDGTPSLGRAAITGDVTISAGSNSATISNDAVTYSKIQNVAGNSFLGRDAAGAGDVGEIAIGASQLAGRGASGNLAAITLGTNLSMSGTTLNATGGGSSGSGPDRYLFFTTT